ncbi:MAG: phosphatidylglycerophosphatase A [Pirellulales bacterium]
MDAFWNRLAVIWATGLGAGFSPIVPGTVGCLWGLPLAWGVFHLPVPWPLRFGLLVVLAAVGVPICQRAASVLGRHDPGSVVWDEIASFPWVFALLPASATEHWPVLLAGFVLHRIFDILKPPPVNWLEKLPGGWGIMADDLGAAAYASLGLYFASPWLLTP